MERHLKGGRCNAIEEDHSAALVCAGDRSYCACSRVRRVLQLEVDQRRRMVELWNPENGEPGPGVALEDWNVSGNTGSGSSRTPVFLSMCSRGRWVGPPSSVHTRRRRPPAAWTEFNCFTESPSVLTFGKSLGSARLEYLAQGTANVWRGSEPWVEVGPDEWELREPDETSTEMVSVIAGWRATGPLTRSTWVNRERSSEFRWSDRSSQSSRKATAAVSVVGAERDCVHERQPQATRRSATRSPTVARRARCPTSLTDRTTVTAQARGPGPS